jgi:sulfite reductase alpha subunit-like flavoprotein
MRCLYFVFVQSVLLFVVSTLAAGAAADDKNAALSAADEDKASALEQLEHAVRSEAAAEKADALEAAAEHEAEALAEASEVGLLNMLNALDPHSSKKRLAPVSQTLASVM